MKSCFSFLLLLNSALNVYSLVMLSIPPRYMWGWGPGMSGYCGEMSTQSVGLYYGNYISQEQVRYAGGNKEVLIDVNLHYACEKLKLTYVRWDNTNEKNPQGLNFLEWSQNFLDNKIPVIGGFYLQEKNGDRDYDHIMPIIGYNSINSELSSIYYNDLYLNTSRELNIPADIKTRSECSQTLPPEQPYNYCQPKTVAYGIAITGNVDINDETYPIQLEIGSWTEPDWGAEDNLNESPILFTGVLTISSLSPSVPYAILRYDSIENLPNQNFLHANSHSYRYDITPLSSSFQFIDPNQFYSNSTIFYRCVRIFTK